MVKVKKEGVLLKPEMFKPSSNKFEILGVFNPAAVRLPNGKILLYVRIWERLIKWKNKKYYYSPRMVGNDKFVLQIDKFDKKSVQHDSDFDFIFKDGTKRLNFISHFRRVLLDESGFNVESIEKRPSFYGLHWDGELGVEDPRISKIGDLYIMTYVSLSILGNVSTSYAVSNDAYKWYRRGIIFGEQDKDVVIFPERINENYFAFDRPEGNFSFTPPHIWINSSKDLDHWGKSKPIIFSKKNDWDYARVGAGPPPIKTDKGWLLIYHGVIDTERKNVRKKIFKRMEVEGLFEDNESIYCSGAALFDLKNPSKLIAKSKVPILIPIRRAEMGVLKWDHNKMVIFPTGVVVEKNAKDILLYSGAGDSCTTVKKISIDRILNKLVKV